jgi:hypothetical protein
MIDRWRRGFAPAFLMTSRYETDAFSKVNSKHRADTSGLNWPAPFSPSGHGGLPGKPQSAYMKRHLKLSMLCLALATLLSTAYGGIPSMDVTVFDATEKVVFRQSINANATFATGNLRPGKYVVQFNTRSAAAKGNQYLLVVSAGSKKVIADGVAGETLTRGGAAMKIQVGSGLQISGQVLNDEAIAQAGGPKYRTIDGKRYLWASAETGSNLGPRWEEITSASARNVIAWNRNELQKRMDRGGEGSMITYKDHYGLSTHY